MKDFYNDHSRFDESNMIHSTAIIHENVTMGKNNIIGAFTVIGGDGEIRGVESFEGTVIIGDGNKISELVTIQRPSIAGQVTKIGNECIIMAHSHIGHDAIIGNNCEISTGAIIGGHCQINDGTQIKLNATIRNRKIIGSNAIIGMGAVAIEDVPANSVQVGNPSRHIRCNKK